MPSAKILAEKQVLVDSLTEKIKNSVAGVVVNYEGITVENDTALRKELRQANVEYKVYKNSYTARACENAGYGMMKESLNGMTAIALSANDPIVAAKIIKNYVEKVEKFEMKAGFVNGEFLNEKQLADLANIPSVEVLVGKILGSIQAPLYNLAYALQAIVDKNGADAAPAEAAAE